MAQITDREYPIQAVHQVVKTKLRPGRYDRGDHKRYSSGLLYVISGGAEYDFHTYSFRVAKDSVFFLAKGSVYDMQVEPDYRVVYCDLDFSGETAFQSGVFKLKNPEAVLAEFHRMYIAELKKEPGSKSEVLSCAYRIYANLQRAAADSYVSPAVRRKLSQVFAYMAENYTDSALRVGDLAARMGVSEVYFRRLFRQVYLQSPARFIGELRLSEAVRLMEYKDLTLAEIAGMCGFSGLYYFSYAFKKKYGVPPSEYRAGIF